MSTCTTPQHSLEGMGLSGCIFSTVVEMWDLLFLKAAVVLKYSYIWIYKSKW